MDTNIIVVAVREIHLGPSAGNFIQPDGLGGGGKAKLRAPHRSGRAKETELVTDYLGIYGSPAIITHSS